MDLEAEFEKYEDEFLKFKSIVDPPSKRPDLCAFLLLDKLVPGGRDMVSSAEHDEIWLDTDCVKLAEVATTEDILYLRRCGIMFDADNESLHSFV